MLSVIASTFGIIFLAELPDKTALAALALATRFRVRDVVLGAWVAFLVQTILAVAAGGLLTALPTRPIRLLAGIGFLVFAVLAWRREGETEGREEDAAARRAGGRRRPAWVSCFLVVLAAEFGDLTQFATAALAAQTRAPLAVGIGALAALWSVTVLAAALGTQAGRLLSGRTLSRLSGVLFAVVGVVVIISTLRG